MLSEKIISGIDIAVRQFYLLTPFVGYSDMVHRIEQFIFSDVLPLYVDRRFIPRFSVAHDYRKGRQGNLRIALYDREDLVRDWWLW
jgi:hypothetical protein